MISISLVTKVIYTIVECPIREIKDALLPKFICYEMNGCLIILLFHKHHSYQQVICYGKQLGISTHYTSDCSLTTSFVSTTVTQGSEGKAACGNLEKAKMSGTIPARIWLSLGWWTIIKIWVCDFLRIHFFIKSNNIISIYSYLIDRGRNWFWSHDIGAIHYITNDKFRIDDHYKSPLKQLSCAQETSRTRKRPLRYYCLGHRAPDTFISSLWNHKMQIEHKTRRVLWNCTSVSAWSLVISIVVTTVPHGSDGNEACENPQYIKMKCWASLYSVWLNPEPSYWMAHAPAVKVSRTEWNASAPSGRSLTRRGIPIIKIRRSRDRLIFIMRILYLERRTLYRDDALAVGSPAFYQKAIGGVSVTQR